MALRRTSEEKKGRICRLYETVSVTHLGICMQRTQPALRCFALASLWSAAAFRQSKLLISRVGNSAGFSPVIKSGRGCIRPTEICRYKAEHPGLMSLAQNRRNLLKDRFTGSQYIPQLQRYSSSYPSTSSRARLGTVSFVDQIKRGQL